MKHRAKRISAGHYIYRGFEIRCHGYHSPDQRVVWECTEKDGRSAFGHSYTLREAKLEIDKEILRIDNHPDAVTARKYMSGDPETVKALHIFDE